MLRLAPFALVATAVAFAAGGCSGSNEAEAQSCQSSDECTEWQCVCGDGFQLGLSECMAGECATADQACGGVCSQHGGVTSAVPTPSVASSPECDAFCAKVESLGCKSSFCDRHAFCRVELGSCEAAARAKLACQVEKGAWQCGDGTGWSESDSCTLDPLLCSLDGGSD